MLGLKFAIGNCLFTFFILRASYYDNQSIQDLTTVRRKDKSVNDFMFEILQ